MSDRVTTFLLSSDRDIDVEYVIEFQIGLVYLDLASSTIFMLWRLAGSVFSLSLLAFLFIEYINGRP